MKKVILFAAMAFVAVTGFAQNKFAHVDFNELIYLMPEMDSAREIMDAAQLEAQETYESMVEEFQSKYSQYQQKAETWTASIRESKERELTDIQNRIEEFNQSVQQELSQRQQELLMPIQQKAQETVQAIAKAAGYVYVFDVASLLYFDESQSVNITPEARKALNIPEGRTLDSLQAELAAKQQQ